jgi:hypothetical protein
MCPPWRIAVIDTYCSTTCFVVLASASNVSAVKSDKLTLYVRNRVNFFIE